MKKAEFRRLNKVKKQIRDHSGVYDSYKQNIATAFQYVCANHKRLCSNKYLSRHNIKSLSEEAAENFLDIWLGV